MPIQLLRLKCLILNFKPKQIERTKKQLPGIECRANACGISVWRMYFSWFRVDIAQGTKQKNVESANTDKKIFISGYSNRCHKWWLDTRMQIYISILWFSGRTKNDWPTGGDRRRLILTLRCNVPSMDTENGGCGRSHCTGRHHGAVCRLGRAHGQTWQKTPPIKSDYEWPWSPFATALTVFLSLSFEQEKQLYLIELLGASASTNSLPAIKLKQFGNSRVIGAYDSNKFCKNGKTKRKYRRRRLNAEKRRLDYIETKRKLLAQRAIVLPKHMTRKKLWARSLTIS